MSAKMTLDEYLSYEARSPVAHEYRAGVTYALAAPSRNHATISMNLALKLGAAARMARCEAYAGDMKLVTPAGERLIPDFVIRCDTDRGELPRSSGENTATDPWLVVEILSERTAATDVTEKLDAYQSVPSVSYYVIIDSRRRAMRFFERLESGRFQTSGSVESVQLPRLGDCLLTLDDVYRDTTVPSVLTFVRESDLAGDAQT